MEILPGEIHVWRIRLDIGQECRRRIYARLDAEERARAAKHYNPSAGWRFAVRRARAKEILASCAGGIDAGQVRFSYGPWGKPYWGSLYFNLSSSHNEAVLAVSGGCEVGIDIERMGMEKNIRGIAEFFHPGEKRDLSLLTPEELEPVFHTMWVRKEAVMKGGGRGLGAGLDRVVTSGREDIRSVHVLDSDGLCVSRWWSPAFFLEGCAMALAVPKNAGTKHIVWHSWGGSFMNRPDCRRETLM
ncbi:MAG: 4'-phosphopantetheinyl transferase superfamily protein [Desulfovibrio sp.]|jgi:4'-phosphopantetheinyl transferase|nr:4'-phosphopantetheinyl transferase superfamily protein [Desulfovibrio sp.]